MHAYFLLINLATAVWVGVDASRIGVRRGRLGGGFFDTSVTFWVLGCLLIWIIAFPCYLVARGRYQTMAAVSRQVAPPAASSWAAPTTSIMSWGTPTEPVAAAAPVAQQPSAAVAPPQLSPDGHWWWNGSAWVPANTVSQPVSPS